MAINWAVHGIGLGGTIELRRDWAALDADAAEEHASADDEVRPMQGSAGSDEIMIHRNVFRVSSSTSKALILPSALQ